MWGYRTTDGQTVCLGYDEETAKKVCEQAGQELMRVHIPQLYPRITKLLKDVGKEIRARRRLLKRGYKIMTMMKGK